MPWRAAISLLAVHLETKISPILDADGTVTHHIAVKRDITERLDKERLLAETNRALEAARDAALALRGDIFVSSGEDARTDAGALFIQTLKPAKKAA